MECKKSDCIADWNSCSCGKSHFFTQLSETKFRCRTPLYHKSHGQCRSMGISKTIPGHWRQVLGRAEVLINVAFIYSLNHRKVARALCDRYAEHFCPQTWWYGRGKLFEYVLQLEWRYKCYYFKGNYILIIQSRIVLKQL